MQDAYVGDIGDYGKYGMLRQVINAGLELGVNWYKVNPTKQGKQNDGRFIEYLSIPERYKHYDPELFDQLIKVVIIDQDREISRIEEQGILDSLFYSEPLKGGRAAWHNKALETLVGADIVFLDPDNGLETERMNRENKATEKHVRWDEVRDYYDRGQSLIIYQHLPQHTKKEQCIEQLVTFGDEILNSDEVWILEFPRYTTRFYAFYLREEHCDKASTVFDQMEKYWQGICAIKRR